jgi:hypothetical protein
MVAVEIVELASMMLNVLMVSVFSPRSDVVVMVSVIH